MYSLISDEDNVMIPFHLIDTKKGVTRWDHSPQGKFGSPEDLLGAMFWLLSRASQFVTGIIVPIDGSFSAFSGV